MWTTDSEQFVFEYYANCLYTQFHLLFCLFFVFRSAFGFSCYCTYYYHSYLIRIHWCCIKHSIWITIILLNGAFITLPFFFVLGSLRLQWTLQLPAAKEKEKIIKKNHCMLEWEQSPHKEVRHSHVHWPPLIVHVLSAAFIRIYAFEFYLNESFLNELTVLKKFSVDSKYP